MPLSFRSQAQQRPGSFSSQVESAGPSLLLASSPQPSFGSFGNTWRESHKRGFPSDSDSDRDSGDSDTDDHGPRVRKNGAKRIRHCPDPDENESADIMVGVQAESEDISKLVEMMALLELARIAHAGLDRRTKSKASRQQKQQPQPQPQPQQQQQQQQKQPLETVAKKGRSRHHDGRKNKRAQYHSVRNQISAMMEHFYGPGAG
ncbi:uncharacterized protein BJ171DRAFT_498080 [Polychytrium aggregatum]|uniref:uncharacterized protein n=1 Tax=Polychytrium aggregatum TaxID=110093 RepID=UPI0022FEA234|nr:uncharacterized protein BJ171DRAFT_498080 [Polychytrium aggregatum]KAI9206522.1 hypothetical protein BJ171DRAFT_498080 [Polychytrium aggregatum]